MFIDYKMNQLVLPMDLSLQLQKMMSHLQRMIWLNRYQKKLLMFFIRVMVVFFYHPKMMMKVILCAYTQSSFSGRKIDALLQDCIRMMWLAQGHAPTCRTINR